MESVVIISFPEQNKTDLWTSGKFFSKEFILFVLHFEQLKVKLVGMIMIVIQYF